MRKKQILHQRARRLRKEQTPVEAILWRRLRGRQFAGFKFRRQLPVKGYIADFCCPERKLILELDGGQHLETTDYDRRRTEVLKSWGYKVLRYWNTEVVENLDGVLEEIFTCLNNPHHLQGEGGSEGIGSKAR